MSDATQFSDDDLRSFATDTLNMHTPAKQAGNKYESRCAECHYTRHPCDVYDLAAGVLRLLERGDPVCRICGHRHGAHDNHLTTVTVQHDASFNESPISEWHAGDPPGPGEPGDASEAT